MAIVAPLAQHGDAVTAAVLDVVERFGQVADVRAFVPDHAVALESLRLFGHDGGLAISNVRSLPTFVGSGEVDHVVYCTGDDDTDRAASIVARLVPGRALAGVVGNGDGPVARAVHDLAIEVTQDVSAAIAAIAADGTSTPTST